MEVRKEFIKTLILLYQQHPCLYVVKSADYHNKTKRDQALETISRDFLKLTKDSITPEVIKTKMNNLRCQYLDHSNKMQKSKKSGAAADDIYKPTWWLFEDMSFLHPHVKARTGELNMQGTFGSSLGSFDDASLADLNDDGSMDDLQFVDVCNTLKRKRDAECQGKFSPTPSVSASSSSHTNRKKKVPPAPDSRNKFWDSMSRTLNTLSADEEPQDGLHHWILHLESELRRKKRNSLKSLKKIIMEVLDDFESD